MAESRRGVLGLCAGVFAILLGSYAYYWQGRDWNAASRLMLVYALGDRGTIRINGLERQTGDLARVGPNYYTEKQPGYSLLGLPVYLAVKTALQLEPHPLGREGFARWPADYWVTLGTSGVATAWAGALLILLACRFGCGPRRALLVGLAYGLATPAYAYATLAYGHQPCAALLLTASALIATDDPRRPPSSWRSFGTGLTASYAATIELSVGPIAAILGLWFAARALRHGPVGLARMFLFGLGALGPSLMLLAYNTLAFGSPFDTGYTHLILPRFREIHSPSNPLGLSPPRWDRLVPLLVGDYRGLLFYAPVVAVGPLGWWRLGRECRWRGLAITSALASATVLLVNLSYPEWTGGWTTGPRFLLPLLPFAAIGVAGFLAGDHRRSIRARTLLVVALALAGFVVVQLFLGIGARVPETYERPLAEVVWPLWSGRPIPAGWIGGRFGGNLATTFVPTLADDLLTPPSSQWVQFAPLWAGQAAGIALLVWGAGRRALRQPTA